ncbi:hypothetical protein HDV00_007117 [Rhizophlyctis rosea]|nr:hypothetical protein HDV00_007117 [Rhizophlyctis rosea]
MTKAVASVRALKGWAGMTFAVDISADGKRIGTGGFDPTSNLPIAMVWDSLTGSCLSTFKGHVKNYNITALKFSQDNKYLFTTSSDRTDRGTLKIWDMATGGIIIELEGHDQAVKDVTISGDDMWVASACQAGKVNVWNLGACTLAGTWTGKHHRPVPVESVDFMKDGAA